MIPLIDADVLCYEIGFASETGWQQEGIPPFDYVADMLDNRIGNICAMVGATAPPILFLTGKTNFRNNLAKRQKYKERVGNKPFHYYNIRAYIQGKYDWREHDGVEADDLMAIEQTRNGLLDSSVPRTIICSRDKDLRTVPGWFYSWELANQPSFGPDLCSDYGWASLSLDRKKIRGRGDKFFYSQCLTGDIVDTIPGLPKCGPVKAASIIEATTTPLEGYNAVLEAYRGIYGDDAEKELLEQAQLLYMVREWNEDGTPKMWEPPSTTEDSGLKPDITVS